MGLSIPSSISAFRRCFMSEKYKSIFLTAATAALLFGFSFWAWFKPDDRFSESERRVLQSLPALTADALRTGKFMEEFETYTLDQFPCRDGFRTIKALTVFHVFLQKDNNGLFTEDGYVSKLNYPMRDEMLNHAAERFQYLYDTYLADTEAKLYFSVVPDKNYFLAQKNSCLSLDYDEFTAKIREKTPYLEYIDIIPELSLQDYYRTDTHWRQEQLLPVANKLASAMGISLLAEYEVQTLSEPFYGVYTGQSALPLKPDTLCYLTNDILEGCNVTSYDTGAPLPVELYDLRAGSGPDPYELFLNGADALLVIENPAAQTDRELIVFRDSFGSSLVPLLVEGYAKITLVDIRYLNSDYLGNFVQFDDQDVLFLYSTLLLNDSLALK